MSIAQAALARPPTETRVTHPHKELTTCGNRVGAFDFSCVLVLPDGVSADLRQTGIQSGESQGTTFFLGARGDAHPLLNGALHLSESSLAHLRPVRDAQPASPRAERDAPARTRRRPARHRSDQVVLEGTSVGESLTGRGAPERARTTWTSCVPTT